MGSRLKEIIKSGIKQLINALAVLMGKTAGGRYFYAQVVNNARSRTQRVDHAGLSLIFSVFNPQNKSCRLLRYCDNSRKAYVQSNMC